MLSIRNLIIHLRVAALLAGPDLPHLVAVFSLVADLLRVVAVSLVGAEVLVVVGAAGIGRVLDSPVSGGLTSA